MEAQPLLNPMEFFPRFRHITEKVFEQLDNINIIKCREVSKYWQECIDSKRFSWVGIVSIPKTPKNTFLHLAGQTGQTKMFEKFFDEEANKNP